MLKDKVTVVSLPTGGADAVERRVFTPKGEMAQILNGSMTVQHLMYWDLDSPKSGQTRGNHYHKAKTEQYYVLTGEVDLTVVDRETTERQVLAVKGGDRITVAPGVAHSFRSRGYAQVLEFSPAPYDASDTVACPV